MNNIHNLPETHEIIYNKATNCLRSGDTESALKMAQSLIKEGYHFGHALAGEAYEKLELYDEAYSHYESAAELAHAMTGWLGLARLCYWGKGVETDYERAFNIYKLLIEDVDDMHCWYMHGIMYHLGRGVEKDIGKAKECFRIAEDKGYVFATTNLALIDWEEGRYVRSIFKRIKAGWRTFMIGIKSGNNDVRISYPPP